MSDDCIDRNYQFKKITLSDPLQKPRFKILSLFNDSPHSSISIGCGSYEPYIINTSHACDISPKAEQYLKEISYEGKFIRADVRSLPFQHKEFDIGICSEVIEHLNTEGDVVLAFSEIDRIAKKWLVTTPAGYSPDPDHKFHFTEEQLRKLISPHPWVIIKHGFFFYISNDENKLKRCIRET
jgi:hypothetical protein